MKIKSQQRYKIERHNGFTEDINYIALSLNDDKRIQSIDLVETYAQVTKKEILMHNREKIKCNNIIKQHKND